MSIFGNRGVVPTHVLVRHLGGESVLLNLESERYFGLDETGTRMLELATAMPSIDAAYEKIPFQRLIEAEPPWFAASQRPGHSTTLRGSSAHCVREFLSSRAPVVAHPLTIRSYSATNLLLVTSLRLSLSSLAGVLELGECAFHPRW